MGKWDLFLALVALWVTVAFFAFVVCVVLRYMAEVVGASISAVIDVYFHCKEEFLHRLGGKLPESEVSEEINGYKN